MLVWSFSAILRRHQITSWYSSVRVHSSGLFLSFSPTCYPYSPCAADMCVCVFLKVTVGHSRQPHLNSLFIQFTLQRQKDSKEEEEVGQ